MSSANPYVSVIMPVYNAGPYLQEAIGSILGQTYSDFELIVVDDGSTDDSASIIHEFKDPRIIFHQLPQNKGNRYAANFALDQVRGKYVVRMDADDISVPDRIALQVEFMDQHPEIGFGGGHLELFGAESAIWKYPLTKDELTCAFLFGTPVPQGVSIVRTKIIMDNAIRYQLSGESYAEDIDFFFRLSKHTSFANIDKVLLKYRRHPSNITSTLKGDGIALNQPVFHSIFAYYGMSVTDEEIAAHLWLNSRFTKNITPEQVHVVFAWKEKLLKWNSENKKFPEPYFSELLQSKWDRLYYLLARRNYPLVKAFMKAQGKWEAKKYFYYLKNRFRKK